MVEKKPVSQLLPAAEAVPVSLLDWRKSYGGILLEEMVALLRVARVINPSIIFESGTFQGETTVQLAVNSQAALSPRAPLRHITGSGLVLHPA